MIIKDITEGRIKKDGVVLPLEKIFFKLKSTNQLK